MPQPSSPGMGTDVGTGHPCASSPSGCKKHQLELGLPDPVPLAALGGRAKTEAGRGQPLRVPASPSQLRVTSGRLPRLPGTRACTTWHGLVINVQTHQRHDESVPRQDHASSPPLRAAFKISAAEEVTRREHSKHGGTCVVHQAGTESWEEDLLIIRDNGTPTAYAVSFALCDLPRVFSPCPVLRLPCTVAPFISEGILPPTLLP